MHSYLTFEKFDQELKGKISSHFDEAARENSEKSEWLKLFWTVALEQARKTHRYINNPGFGNARKIAEDGTRTATAPSKPLDKTYKDIHVYDSMEVTKDHRLYIAEHYDFIMRQPTRMAENIFDDIARDFASVINYAWAEDRVDAYGDTVDNTAVDMAPIFSKNHVFSGDVSPVTFSNVIVHGSTYNPALWYASLQSALLGGLKFTNSRGVVSSMKYDTLYIAPNLKFIVDELLYSEKKVGTQLNTKTSLGDIKTVKVLDYLDDGIWFVGVGSKFNECISAEFSQIPQLGDMNIIDRTFKAEYVADAYYKILIKDCRYIAGSDGSGIDHED